MKNRPFIVCSTIPRWSWARAMLQGFKQRFLPRAMFKAFVEKMRRDGFAPFQIAGEPGAFWRGDAPSRQHLRRTFPFHRMDARHETGVRLIWRPN